MLKRAGMRAPVWRVVLACALMLSAPAPALLGSTESVLIAVDVPALEEQIANGQTVLVAGWAADTSGPGTGINGVHVYVDVGADSGGAEIGIAAYGRARPDVAAAFGRPEWANSGYDLEWPVSGLAPGAHTLYVYAHSSATDEWTLTTRAINVGLGALIPPGPLAPVGSPRGGLNISILDFAFQPQELTIPLGATVTWLNTGPSAHTATSDALVWDSGAVAGGQFYSFTFNAPGSYRYHCAIHSRMRGTVTVSGGVAEARPVEAAPAVISPYGAILLYGAVPPFTLSPTVAATAGSDGTVALSWTPRASAITYRVYESPSGDPDSFALLQVVSQTLNVLGANVTIMGLLPGTTHYFQIKAADYTGFETLLPVAVGNVSGVTPTISATASFNGTVTLTWQPAPGVMSYRVYQSSSGATNTFGLIRTVPQSLAVIAASVTISGLTPGSTSYFQVRATHPNGQETQLPVTAMIGIDVVPAPTGLSASPAGAGAANLAWTPSAGAASYRVYQSTTGAAGSFSPAVLTVPTHSGATVTGLAPGTTYFFYIMAVAASGQESAASNMASMTTLGSIPRSAPPSPTPIPTATPIPAPSRTPATAGASDNR